MGYHISSEQLEIAFSSGSLTIKGKTINFEVVKLGELEITSGLIGASDPFVYPQPEPFNIPVPKGIHPVEIAIAKTPDGDNRVAFARVLFSPQSNVKHWEMALIKDQNINELDPESNEFFGYGVDTGTGCFMDIHTGDILGARMDQEEEYFQKMLDCMDINYVDTMSWLEFRPSESSSLNVICFSSGWGDGAYPSFFGMNMSGEPVTLVTDFLILR